LIEKIEIDRDAEPSPPRDENAWRLLKLFIVLMPACAAIYLGAVIFVTGESMLRSTGVIAALCSALGAFALLRRNRGEQAAQVLVWGVWLSLQLQIFISNGLSSRSLMALPIVIMLAGWLLPARNAIVLCFATIFFGLALALGEHAGELPLYVAPSPPILVWLAVSTYVALAAALAYYIFRGFHLRHEALRRSEEKFATAFRAGPLAMSLTRLADGRYLDVNDAFVKLLGWRREEIIGRNSLECGTWLAPEDRRAWVSELSGAGRLSNREMRFRAKSGVLRDVRVSSGLVEIDGEPCVLVLASDITESKRAGEKFVKVFHASPEPISISRLRDGLYLDVNNAFVEQFGWGREELIGRNPVDLGLWSSRSDRQRWAAQLRKSGRLRNAEAHLNTRAGERRIVLVSAELILIEGEECIIGMVIDITEQLRTRKALQGSEARLKEAQRIGHVGSWDLDLASKRMSGSDEMHRIFERAPGSFGGTFEDYLKMVHPDDLPIVRKAWRESAQARGICELEHRILTPDGHVKHLHARWEVGRGGDGKPLHMLGTAQDITEQVSAREEIRHLNTRLEQRVLDRTAELTAANRELESFAYSISHDLRAPLRSIDGFSHLLEDEYGERLDAQGRDYLGRVRRAAQRMGGLIDDILDLSRITRQEMRRVRVNLGQIAEDLIDERHRAEPQHRVEVALATDCIASGDPQLLRVMLQNLLENAWKYSSKADAPRIEFGCEQSAGETVYFVRDNGVGFDMKYADRIFSPFQRLHKPEEFEGSGIGLATVARIVHRHGGRIWTESEPGKGATFRFTLGNPSDILR
jgi:PAS domain S-box-containing protein